MPVARNLTQAHREGYWPLYLSSVRSAIPLFFAFNHTNYSRWTPLFFEDCLNLEERFPLIYQEFMAGNFVVRLTQRKTTAIPMDQALEKEYNKVAKGGGGIIVITPVGGGGGGTHLVTDTMVLSANYAKLQLGPPPPTVSTKCTNCIS